MSGRGSERILALIEWMAKQTEPVALSQVVAALKLPKSSGLGLLRMLVDLGYAERTDDTHYRLVRLPGEITGPDAARGTLLRLLTPVINDAAASAGESGFLAVLEPNLTVLYLNKVMPDREIRYDRDISVPRQPHQVSSGLVLLKTLTDEEIQDYASSLPQEAGKSLVADVRATAARGYAITRLGVVEGASGVAAPVFGPTGEIVAALNIAGPALRMSRDIETFVEHAVSFAAQATEVLRQNDFRKMKTGTGTNKA
ncbi:MAG: IclR family transcriptional regulator C-terminal domain-containing protein [Pseudomonadota bacterium]